MPSWEESPPRSFSRAPHVAVVMMSVVDDREVLREPWPPERDYLIKPFNAEDLVRAIRRCKRQ